MTERSRVSPVEPDSGGLLASPRASGALMTATYVIGATGYLIGFTLVGGNPDGAIRWVAGLSVGAVGVVSVVRHAFFHRGDAVRMGWDSGTRNNFQIETGVANGAIGAVALAGVALNWSVAALATVTLVYAAYFAGVTVVKLSARDNDRWAVNALLVAAQAVILGYFAVAAGFTT